MFGTKNKSERETAGKMYVNQCIVCSGSCIDSSTVKSLFLRSLVMQVFVVPLKLSECLQNKGWA